MGVVENLRYGDRHPPIVSGFSGGGVRLLFLLRGAVVVCRLRGLRDSSHTPRWFIRAVMLAPSVLRRLIGRFDV